MHLRSHLVFLVLSLLTSSFAVASQTAEGLPKGPTAEEALKLLKEGNGRFVAGKSTRPHGDRKRVKETASGQHPFAIILGCSDSRTPPELVFDRGVGDLFVVRVAGNVSLPATLGSVEYAASHLGAPLIVVLGHHNCGAVKATVEGAGSEGNIGSLVGEIQPVVEDAKKAPGKEGVVNTATHANAKLAAAQLTSESPVLKKLAEEHKVKVVSAVYDLETGTLEWDSP